MDWFRYQYLSEFFSNRTWNLLHLHFLLPRARTSQPYQHNSYNRDGYNDHKHFRVQPVAAGLLSIFLLPINAQADVGGVSATSNPVANSSGSATVNAYQVLTGNFINSTFGQSGVVCQAETMTVSPYLGLSHNIKRPFKTSYKDPVYDMRDIDGDGAPDNPGDILFEKDVLTQQRDNHGVNYGLTIQWSRPLDSELQSLCKSAASTEIALRRAELNLKVLDYEISRLKHCGNLKKDGISHIKSSDYAVICADISVSNHPSSVPEHSHTITPIVNTTTSKETSVLGGVHERRAPWASSSEDEVEPSSKSSSPEGESV